MTNSLLEGFSERIIQEVDFDNPWVEKYRVPIVRDMYSSTYFIAQLVVPSTKEHSNIFNYLAPSEEDAELVGKYIQFRKQSLAPWYVKKMNERSLDIDSGVNTISFALMKHGWVYNRSTWRNQPFFPYHDNKIQFPTLLELINHERTFVDEVDSKWVEFLEENS